MSVLIQIYMRLIQHVSTITYTHLQGVLNKQRAYGFKMQLRDSKWLKTHKYAVTVSAYDVKNYQV
jgi:hypothetical protein